MPDNRAGETKCEWCSQVAVYRFSIQHHRYIGLCPECFDRGYPTDPEWLGLYAKERSNG